MKILIIGQTPPPFGGQSINIEKIIKALGKYSFDYRFIRMDFSKGLDENGKFTFAKIIKLISIFFRILFCLLWYRPKYVYYPPSGAERIPVYRDILLLFPIVFFRFRIIFHFHAGGLSELYNQLNGITKAVFKFIFFKPAYSICMSEFGKRDPLFLECKNITIIPYGVEDPGKTNINQEGFKVLFAGVCRESKGILDFIKIIEKANSINKTIKGIILGTTFSEKEETAIKKADEKGLVNYLGVKTGKEKEEVFKSAKLFLFPTFFEHENFPTVNLEAFSYGMPVISTYWRGVRDQITFGINGYIFEIHDVDSMANSIIKIVEDPQLYLTLSQNARKEFELKYKAQYFEDNVVAFFKQLKP